MHFWKEGVEIKQQLRKQSFLILVCSDCVRLNMGLIWWGRKKHETTSVIDVNPFCRTDITALK